MPVRRQQDNFLLKKTTEPPDTKPSGCYFSIENTTENYRTSKNPKENKNRGLAEGEKMLQEALGCRLASLEDEKELLGV